MSLFVTSRSYSLENAADIIKNVCLQVNRTSNKRKALFLTLGATVALVIRSVYRLFRVPRSLRHLPSVNVIPLALSILKNEDASTRARTVFASAMKQGNGVFVVGYEQVVQATNQGNSFLFLVERFPKRLEVLSASHEESPSIKYFGTNSVGFVSGESWRKQRKVMNPAFRKSMPIHMFGSLTKRSFKIIEDHPGRQVPILPYFQRVTLDAIGIAGFGFDFGAIEDMNSVWPQTYETIRHGLFSPIVLFPFLDWLLGYIFPSHWGKLNGAIDKLNGLLMDMAKQKREQLQASVDSLTPENEKDLLTLMLEAELRGEGSASDEELQGNLALFFFAGHDTTANSMSFCLYNLAVHQNVQSKARDDVLGVMGDGKEDILPTTDDLRQIPYLEMILKETLRQFAPTPTLMPRSCKEDTDLNGIFIPKNTPIIVELDALHNNPAVWKNPERFDPDRFAPDGENQTRFQGAAWLPFSAGHRGCIGLNFSLTQQRILLAMLLRKYTWRLPDDSIHRDGIKIGNFQNTTPASLVIEFHPRY
ncbi:hypothetical protein [Absidia glauca]|uniref:Cytochrome P450 n=1 Tax=Absidia glauca TaxID=4829 RepID=A0A163M015_ABSGL|nr:hypothetical protein [Absidia glauca]